jgi:cytochrome oxidase assembly protein ShyY1
MLLLIDIFSINRSRGYENPSLDIIVIELFSTGGFPLEEAHEHCFQNQSVIYLLFLYHFSAIVVIVLVILLLFCHF